MRRYSNKIKVGKMLKYSKIIRVTPTYILCKCICGNLIIDYKHTKLTPLYSLHCGCITKRKEDTYWRKEHPKYKAFTTWRSMCCRCKYESSISYKWYGGRGITVCEEWANNFDKFYEDMGSPPIGLQLDRINNDKGYSKDNCRWVTSKVNNNNRRKKSINSLP